MKPIPSVRLAPPKDLRVGLMNVVSQHSPMKKYDVDQSTMHPLYHPCIVLC